MVALDLVDLAVRAKVRSSLGCWAQESRSRCSRSWSGGISGMLNSSHQGQQRPAVLEVVSGTTGSVVKNEEIIQGSFRCREFLLVKQISC